MNESSDFQKHLSESQKNPDFQAEFEAWRLPMELSKKLQDARHNQKLTQIELAKKLGVPQQVVSKLETMTGGVPKLSTLQRLADALGYRLEFALVPKTQAVRESNEQEATIESVVRQLQDFQKKFEKFVAESRASTVSPYRTVRTYYGSMLNASSTDSRRVIVGQVASKWDPSQFAVISNDPAEKAS